MNRNTVERARLEALHFVRRCDELLTTKVGEYNAATGDWSPGSWQYYGSPKQTGAVRRASMDLTRSLAEMRRP